MSTPQQDFWKWRAEHQGFYFGADVIETPQVLYIRERFSAPGMDNLACVIYRARRLWRRPKNGGEA